MLDRDLRLPALLLQHLPGTTCVPGSRGPSVLHLNTPADRKWLLENDISLEGALRTAHCESSIPVAFPEAAGFEYPFSGVQSYLRGPDIVFCNLECPLSAGGRRTRTDGYYRASPEFVRAMAGANISVCSFSNNHCMDYGEVAFRETVELLESHSIRCVGALTEHDELRRVAIVERRAARVAFFGYNAVGPEVTYALPGECGVVPLNEVVVAKDVESARGTSDWLIASVHWGIEGANQPVPQQVREAHTLIDKGFDAVLGHHPHVPGAIEIYRDRPILYSLGNLIFGHSHTYWGDNILARLQLTATGVTVEVVPISGQGDEAYCPALLAGERAGQCVNRLREASRPFGTNLMFDGAVATVTSRPSWGNSDPA